MFTYEKKPAFDSGYNLSDLFSSFVNHKGGTEFKKVERQENKKASIIYFLCGSDGKNYLVYHATPKQILIDVIESQMLAIDYDSIGFKIVVFPDSIDIYAEYGQIIGSRLIGNFPLVQWQEMIKE